jgi:phosphoglucomutase
VRITEKCFVQNTPYDERGSIYYKPVEKFVKFGTSGVRWLVKGASGLLTADKLRYYISNGYARNAGGREVLAEDFISPNVGAVVKAIALYLLKRTWPSEKRVLLTYDNRPGNLEYSVLAAKILAAYGIRPVLSVSDKNFVPTPLPAGSRLVKDGGYAGHIMFTASHNGDEWNGIKFESSDGSAAGPDITVEMGAMLLDELAIKDPAKPVTYRAAQDAVEALIAEDVVETADVIGHYVKAISGYLDIGAIKRAIKEGRVEFYYSAFFGSSGPAIVKLFEELGLPTDGIIETVKSENEAYVASYEPTLERLKRLMALVGKRGAGAKARGRDTVVIGGAADNDADRFQVNEYNPGTGQVDEYTPEKLAAVLGHYLCKYKGFKGPFGRSFVSGTLQDRVAELFACAAIETPTGFKYAPRVFGKGGVLFTEESYGLSFKNWTLDKDGILPSLLALEVVAVTGRSLGDYYLNILSELRKAGLPSEIFFKRYDMPLDSLSKKKAVDNFTGFFNSIAPGRTEFADKMIAKAYDPKDYEAGMKFILNDGGWIALRASGTEPLIRLYIEARDARESDLLKSASLKLMSI